MATKKSQRIGIWVIAITMMVGTVGGFLVMALAPQNQKDDQARLDTLQKEFQTEYREYEDKTASHLSKKYYDTFKQYSSRVASFSADDVTKLKKNDIKKGDGDTLTSQSTFQAYYIGWTPDGKIFDSSLNDTSLKIPLNVTPGQVIEGWTEGVDGMKVGGVRELTIPSDKAYGEKGHGSEIPANTPLKFVIMTIPPEDTSEIEAPKMSDELKQLYSRMNGIDPSLLEGM